MLIGHLEGESKSLNPLGTDRQKRYEKPLPGAPYQIDVRDALVVFPAPI